MKNNIKTIQLNYFDEPLRFAVGMGPNSLLGMLAEENLTQEIALESVEGLYVPENTDFFIEVWDSTMIPPRWVTVVSPEISAVPFNEVYRRS